MQASVIELLVELQQRRGTSYLFITHDINLIRQIAHRIVVMYQGEVVEVVDAGDIVTAAQHSYTRSLIAAVPQSLATNATRPLAQA